MYISQVAGENPDPLTILRDSFNAVVCADETAMDRDIFGLSRPVTLEMMFPSAECSLYRSQCEICLSTSTCSNNSEFWQRHALKLCACLCALAL